MATPHFGWDGCCLLVAIVSKGQLGQIERV